MKILIIGAGVLGCNMAHNFWKAGKDVTLLARGKWGEMLKEKGLVIKNKFSIRPSCDKIPIVSELKREEFIRSLMQIRNAIWRLKRLGMNYFRKEKKIIVPRNTVRCVIGFTG